MHDCGHSPFSHTFEHYYTYNKEKEINDKLAEYFADDRFFHDDFVSASPAAHELISAIILLANFSNQIKSNNASPQLAARMILGCKYENDSDLDKKFENKLISLLNGSGIDVDTLDYIQRDSWASGVSNVDIDYARLLSSIMIKPDSQGIPKIMFKKNVLSVLGNISQGRNFLYKWVYSHHKVNYEQYLLSRIVEKINTDSKGEFCNKIFSIQSFSEPQIFNNTTYFLPTDDDIIHTIKQFSLSDLKIEEYLSRSHKLIAIWKTYFEFKEAHFDNISSANRMGIYSKLQKGALTKKYGENSILCLKCTPKLKSINQNDFFIDVDGKSIDASKATVQSNENLDYFITYTTEDLISKKEDIIIDILNLQS
ncbi:MAG: hypothetical protein HC905_02910 [Bacteroidales bacterium]|nr:hypothetical protein [Bacteroidales bacterium]